MAYDFTTNPGIPFASTTRPVVENKPGVYAWEGDQTFDGRVIFNDGFIWEVVTIAAAGSTQATATAVTLLSPLNNVTGADGTKGVVLPSVATALIGSNVRLINNSASALNVYPPLGYTVNGGTVNAAYSLTANTTKLFVTPDGNNWFN